MSEREVRRAMNALCSAAMAGKSYRPESCQRCESPCKYGMLILRQHGLARLAEKETPAERSGIMSSRRLRNRVRGYNKYSITR